MTSESWHQANIEARLAAPHRRNCGAPMRLVKPWKSEHTWKAFLGDLRSTPQAVEVARATKVMTVANRQALRAVRAIDSWERRREALWVSA